MIDGKRIIAIPPAFNEEGKIGNVVRKIPKDVVDEILVVCDGCTDNTLKEAMAAGASVIEQPKRMGIGSAIRTGIEYAINKKFDIIVILAGNDKDDPSQIPALVQPLITENFDYIQGSRYLPGGESGELPFHRKVGTRLYPFLIELFTGFKMTDATNGFRAFKSELFLDKRINLNQEWLNGYQLEYYLLIKVIELGYKIKEVPVRKIYPQTVNYKKYTKVVPIIDWWHSLSPLFYLKLKIKK